MKKTLSILMTLLLALPVLPAVPAFGQVNYRPPTIYQSAALTVKRTAGTVNNGGKPVAIAADTTGAAMTDSKNDCSAPTYTACNIIFANSSGTVTTTTSIATASASGDVILAYVTTAAGAITSIVYGWQNGAAFSAGSSTGAGSSAAIANCGTLVACANTAVPTAKIVYGTVPFTSASPSTATITGLPFTSSSSYVCTASPVGATAAIAAAGAAFGNVSGASTVITGPNTVTTVIDFICIGT